MNKSKMEAMLRQIAQQALGAVGDAETFEGAHDGHGGASDAAVSTIQKSSRHSRVVEKKEVHKLGNAFVCETDSRGHATPQSRTPLELVLDASEGFIPLWEQGVTLRWRFNEVSLSLFPDPEAVKTDVRELLADALLAWGDAAPVKFSERDDAWDFEIVVRNNDRCTINGCTLARAFFPDAGRHDLEILPKMFTQSRKEQVDTLIHETGHVFGLRHFFAKVRESAWPSEVFGTHRAFSIMNYGHLSELTPEDRGDLKRLYSMAWSGALNNVNGTPIRLVKPFHASGSPV